MENITLSSCQKDTLTSACPGITDSIDYKACYVSQSKRLRELERDFTKRGEHIDNLNGIVVQLKSQSESEVQEVKKLNELYRKTIKTTKESQTELLSLKARFNSQLERVAQLEKDYSLRGEEIDNIQGLHASVVASNKRELTESRKKCEKFSSEIKNVEGKRMNEAALNVSLLDDLNSKKLNLKNLEGQLLDSITELSDVKCNAEHTELKLSHFRSSLKEKDEKLKSISLALVKSQEAYRIN